MYTAALAVADGPARVRPRCAHQLDLTNIALVLGDASQHDVLSVSETKDIRMHIGYARTSTAEQEAGLKAQERDLRAAGCQKVFSERVSSVARRERLDAALDYVREGDMLIVTRPDRLARSTADL